MSSGITKENLMRVLPAPLRNDQGMYNLGETAAEALSMLWDQVDLPQIYASIGTLPESLLDILAKDFHVTWYDYDLPIEEKRKVIRDSFYVHRHLGTRAAVSRTLYDVFGDGRVEEWFQYGGAPYHFRVYTTNVTVLQENRERFLHLLSQVKNVRSVLENVIYNGASSAARIYAATKCVGLAAHSAGTAKNYYKER